MHGRTLRVYRVVTSFRLRGRVLWAGDRVVLKESEAAAFVARGDLELAASSELMTR